MYSATLISVAELLCKFIAIQEGLSMANLTVNIDVSDDQFEQLCVNTIHELPKNILQDIVVEAIKSELASPGLFYNYGKDSWGGTRSDIKNPTNFTMKIINSMDLDKCIGPVADEVANFIHDNFEDIVKKYVIETFASMLFTNMTQSSFRSDIANMIENMQSLNRRGN